MFHVPCSMCHVPCDVHVCMCHVPCSSATKAAGGDETKVLPRQKPLHRYPPPLLLIIPQPFLQRENLWHYELILVCHIISVTFSSFKMAEGILNHDIFLFVPNISTKALPVKKISRKLVWVQIDLNLQFTKIRST